jgi:aspartate/methionine/tyrosine aminotransferase
MEAQMNIPVFKLEDYLTHYEFSAPYLLCCSDAESFSMQEIIAQAEPQEKTLWDNLRLSYTEAAGLPLLRTCIAQNLYPSLAASNILCCAGAEEGIFSALHALCEAGDHVIVLTPCYQSLLEVPKLKHAVITQVALREENDWRIDLAAIKQALRPNTTGIVINFPHNPTGQVITPTELNELVALCAAHDLWLFSDEVYRLLGSPVTGWAMPAAELYPKALSLGVMSKAFGMAGLRIGWLACQDTQLLKKIERVKHYLSICTSAPAEIISLIALNNKDKILARNNQIVAENLNYLASFMADYHDLFTWVQPQGGCVGFVNYKGAGSIEDFSASLVKDKGVLLMPASIYDHHSNYFRIGFGRKNMPEALAKLKEFIATQM